MLLPAGTCHAICPNRAADVGATGAIVPVRWGLLLNISQFSAAKAKLAKDTSTRAVKNKIHAVLRVLCFIVWFFMKNPPFV